MAPAPAPALTCERIPEQQGTPASRPEAPSAVPVVPVPRPASDLVMRRRSGVAQIPAVAAEELGRLRPDYVDVVAWLSEHLAALHRVVYPAAARQLPSARRALTVQRAGSRDLEQALRRLHAHLNGDADAPRRELSQLHSQLLQALQRHSQGEHKLLERLEQSLPEQDWNGLAARYRASLGHGPTRPHPHVPHSGLAGRLAYRAAALCDRVLDVLDSRPVHPVPPATSPA
jgi:hypothetical protein